MSTGYFFSLPLGEGGFCRRQKTDEGKFILKSEKNGRIISAPTVMSKNPGLKICNTKNKFS